MASIFTYETEIPRVSSPWLRQLEAAKSSNTSTSEDHDPRARNQTSPILHEDGAVTRLEAEPQEGPVEYKLHLLLRARRNFTHMTTVSNASGSNQNNIKYNGPHSSRSTSENASASGTTPVSTQQSRQHRLEQLTTQLLWRLQQSSPHHASSSTNVVLPSFPEALPELRAPLQPAKLPHGLEESQGALYEIGVSDDGTFVGLAEDEMKESLNNLRAMAACLGCVVEVQRMVEVGQCDWKEETFIGDNAEIIPRKGKLLVAEALVKPYLHNITPLPSLQDAKGKRDLAKQYLADTYPTAQLRVSFTGATMSGKSSLLGALSTSTLDNGRGQSRLSMLKHRHEITSGVTSSITQELLGYRDGPDGEIEVINYASEGISSWIDMHAAATDGRLVFTSDSAGHPRYRRTTVRGLVGWDPHWAILCIPADDEGDSSGRIGSTPSKGEMLGLDTSTVDLSAAHLDLCLRLDLPLVVAITKFDLASKTGLRLTLAKLLSLIKGAGRQPIVIPNPPGIVTEESLQVVKERTARSIRAALGPVSKEPNHFVPIVMTSAVQGAGLDVFHALLRELPVPKMIEASNVGTTFHIEDVYNRTLDAKAIVVSGHLASGNISVGDKFILGPSFAGSDDSEDSDGQQRPISSKVLATSRSFPGALKGSISLLARGRTAEQEWRQVVVSSIRNLRLPVNILRSDQVGTIGLQLVDSDDPSLLASLKIRKGMVLCNSTVKSTSTLVARFEREDLGSLAVGSRVVLYITSIRASARVLSARTPDVAELVTKDGIVEANTAPPNADGKLAECGSTFAGSITDRFLMVTLHLESNKEYIRIGSKVLVMPGGGPGLFGGGERGEKGVAGLEGFVGTVTETFN